MTRTCLPLALWLLLQAAPPAAVERIIIDKPEEGLPAFGRSALSAHVEPASTKVRTVELLVDGVSVCRRSAPPFECEFDAGPRGASREVRAVALLQDGRRIFASRKTLEYAATLTDTTEVNAVIVPVLVLSSRSQAITNLSKENFELLDEGVPQEFVVSSENPQSQLAIAIDRSPSMKERFDEVRTAVLGFMDGFQPPDLVTLSVFNHEFTTLTLRESDPARRRQKLADVKLAGGTALYDAIYNSLDTFGDEMALKTVVVISDGEDSHSRVQVPALAAKIRGNDAVVYVLMRRSAEGSAKAHQTLGDFIRGSGGTWFEVENRRELTDALNVIAINAKQQYLLGFTPTTAATGPRRLEVRVKGVSNVKVIARTVYGPVNGR